MATKTRKPKKKPKLRGGTNAPSADSIIPLDELLEQEAAADAEANGKPEGWPDGKAYVDGMNIDKPIPMEPTVAPEPINDLAGQLADEAIARAESNGKPDAPDSPERLRKWDAETLKLVNRSAKEVAELRGDHDAKAELAKEAKKRLDLALTEHFDLLRDRREGRGKPQQQTLFDKTHGHAAAQPDLREPSEVPSPPEDDAWRKVPLTELVDNDGLPAKVANLLATGQRKSSPMPYPIVTLGDLVAYQEPEASGFTKRLTDILGIGPSKVDAIEAATAAYWKRRKAEEASRATEPATGSGSPEPAAHVDGGEPVGDSPAGGAGAAQAEPSANGDGQPAGYQGTDGEVKRIGKRMRGNRK